MLLLLKATISRQDECAKHNEFDILSKNTKKTFHTFVFINSKKILTTCHVNRRQDLFCYVVIKVAEEIKPHINFTFRFLDYKNPKGHVSWGEISSRMDELEITRSTSSAFLCYLLLCRRKKKSSISCFLLIFLTAFDLYSLFSIVLVMCKKLTNAFYKQKKTKKKVYIVDTICIKFNIDAV